MIVDVHTHTPTHAGPVPAELAGGSDWGQGSVRTARSWAEYEADLASVDASIAFTIAVPDPLHDTGLVGDPARINDATIDFVAAHRERRIGFGSVNPTVSGWQDEVERCVAAGLVGIKIGANYQRFDPLGDDARELYALAERRGLPILFHQGASPITAAPLRYSHPLATDEIAIAHPELRIVMAHLAHPYTREAVTVIRKHPHVYADVSALVSRPWTLYEGLLFAHEWGSGQKLLFGSDYPIITPEQTMAALRSVNDVVAGTGMPRIPDDLVEGIIQADALGALGLELPTPTATDNQTIGTA